MYSFLRLGPFVWPHRRKFLLSVLFAVLVAVLWAVNLSFTFLIVKVLLQEQSLPEYVHQQIQTSETEIERRTQVVDALDARIQSLTDEGTAEDSEQLKQLITERSRQHRKVSAASRTVWMMNWVQTTVLPFTPDDQFDTYALILGLLLLATSVKGVSIFIQEVLIGSVVQLAVMGVRKACFRHALSLDVQTLSLNGTADLMSRFTNDINVMTTGLDLLGGKVIREPLKAMVCIVAALLLNWQLTLLSFIFVPVMGLVFYRYGRVLKHASHRMMESMSRIYKVLEETFDAVKIVIAFDRLRLHRQRFHRENKEYYHKSMQVVSVDALTNPTTELLGIFAVAVALLPGAYLVLRGTTEIWNIRLSSDVMDIAELSLLYAYLVGVLDPARKLSSVYAKLRRAAAATERILQLLDRRTLVNEVAEPLALPRHSRSIVFDKVSFSYARGDRNAPHRPAALHDVSLRVDAGDVIAIVGANGSGKSTLVNLLPRFFDCDHGAVLIDGVDIREVRLRDLRRQISVVTQETLLFDDTIYENIRYGNAEATRDQVVQAAEHARVTEFVGQQPEGFETLVGEKGQRLSGGQRQRIALARAILRDPAILILDEATSAVDARSEALIHQALCEFVKKRTVFLITHSVSPSLLELVSRIAVMIDGKLAATGSHATLIESCPEYQRLYHARSPLRSGGNEKTPIADAA